MQVGPEAAVEGRQGSCLGSQRVNDVQLVGSFLLNPCSMKPRRSGLSGNNARQRKGSLSSYYSGDDAHVLSSPQAGGWTEAQRRS